MNFDIWQLIYNETKSKREKEPLLKDFFDKLVLDHSSLEEAISCIIGEKLTSSSLTEKTIKDIALKAIKSDPHILKSIVEDLKVSKLRDPACKEYATTLLFYKGFQAIQSYRVANYLWKEKKTCLALFFQSRMNEVFAVDIHPAAKIGHGLLFDHATSIVIGETAVIENNVSLLQEVTLGGTGKETGDRHPKVRKGVLIGAGAKILGNVEIGEGAKIGAGSVVLQDVPPHKTAAGVPAKIIGSPHFDSPAIEMNHSLSE